MVSESDVRRLFLQAVISRGVLSGKLARTLWLKCINAVQAANDELEIPHSEDAAAWSDFVNKVNKSIDALDLEFRHLNDEVTGKEMYAIVNRKGDEIAQMATEYSSLEIAYFKAVVEQIILAPNEAFSVSSLAALREVNSLKTNMSKTQAEVVLGSFVAKGWLLKSPRGRYSLSTRTLLELVPYLESYEGVHGCTICFEIVTRGSACFTANCKARMHARCFATYRLRNDSCPSCNQPWPQQAVPPLLPVGEDAAKDDAGGGRRRVRWRSADVEEEEGAGGGEDEEEEPEEPEDQPMDEDEPSQPTQTQKTRSQRRARFQFDEE